MLVAADRGGYVRSAMVGVAHARVPKLGVYLVGCRALFCIVSIGAWAMAASPLRAQSGGQVVEQRDTEPAVEPNPPRVPGLLSSSRRTLDLSSVEALAEADGMRVVAPAGATSNLDPGESPDIRVEDAAPKIVPGSGQQPSSFGASAAPASRGRGEHEAVVALPHGAEIGCSGVVVAPRVVLTAAHCMHLRRVNFGFDVGAPWAQRTVARALRAPGRGWDLAALVLDEDAPVKPLSFVQQAQHAPPGRVRAVGYGYTDVRATRGAGLRQWIEIPVRSWGCTARVSERKGCLPALEMVLPRADGADTCRGDSGGPLLVREGEDWRVLAITSRAVRDARQLCGDGGVYVRTDRAAAWLNEIVGSLERSEESK